MAPATQLSDVAPLRRATLVRNCARFFRDAATCSNAVATDRPASRDSPTHYALQLAKRVAVFGSTGSIGRSALEVIAASDGPAAGRRPVGPHASSPSWSSRPARISPAGSIATDAKAAAAFDWSGLPKDVRAAHRPRRPGASRRRRGRRRRAGRDRRPRRAAKAPGPRSRARKPSPWRTKKRWSWPARWSPSWPARRAASCCRSTASTARCFRPCRPAEPSEVERLILTASGGPFKHLSPGRTAASDGRRGPGPPHLVDGAQDHHRLGHDDEQGPGDHRGPLAVRHRRPEQIDVVIHPQSIVHSLVEFVDGSVMAQMSPPDMRLPIQYALNYPERSPGVGRAARLAQALRLEFEPPDRERFPGDRAGRRSGPRRRHQRRRAERGQRSGRRRRFSTASYTLPKSSRHAAACWRHINFEPNPTLERLLELDRWAREEISRWVCA